jgi:hypothetical protein
MTDTPDLTPEYAEAVAARLELVGWQPLGERDEGAALIRAQAAEIARLKAASRSQAMDHLALDMQVTDALAELARLRATRADELARAYMLGVEAASRVVVQNSEWVRSTDSSRHVQPRSEGDRLGLGYAAAIRALTPPADLADRVKGGE